MAPTIPAKTRRKSPPPPLAADPDRVKKKRKTPPSEAKEADAMAMPRRSRPRPPMPAGGPGPGSSRAPGPPPTSSASWRPSPRTAALFAALDGRLERKGVGARDLADKQRSLRRRYGRDARKAAPPADDHERRLFLLSGDIWGAGSRPAPPPAPRNPRTAQDKDALPLKARTLAEMRELYPFLVDEAVLLVDPAVLEKILPTIDDGEAQALDKKINRIRRGLVRTVTESATMGNMEMPTVFLPKLQPEKLRAENENNLLFDRLDKMDDVDICAKGRLARVEHELVELKQIALASHSQAKIERLLSHDNSSVKGRCESTESGLQLIVAENQIPRNVLKKRIQAENGLRLPHEKNEEVTSKYKYHVPRNFPPDYLNRQGMILPPINSFCGRTRNIDAGSQIQNYVGGKEVILVSLVRPYTPVAKAILQPGSWSTIVGGMPLGMQCRKVFVIDVLKGEAPLLRQYGNMKTMSNALKRSIAWPSVQIRDNTTAIEAAPDQPRHLGH